MTNDKLLKIVLIILPIVLLGGAAYYFYTDFKDINGVKSINPPPQDKSLGTTDNNQVKPESKDKKQVPAAILNLDKPIVITENLSIEQRETLTAKIKDIIKAIKADTNLYSHWLDLGIYRKMIGDYAGAIEAWEYASVLQPKVAVPFNNLANIYAYYLKDYIMAEKYYLKAIETEPQQSYYYGATHEFYRYALKDKVKAKAILEKGIATVSDKAPLKAMLESLESNE